MGMFDSLIDIQKKNELLKLGKQIDVFEIDGRSFYGIYSKAVHDYVDSNSSKEFMVWLRNNYHEIGRLHNFRS